MPLCCCCKPQSRVAFDVKSFCDNVYDIGRPYRNRAIELIKICQLFSVASNQSFSQDTELLRVIKKCDEAISYAINSRSGKRESQEADHKFDEAIERLRKYESKFHPRSDVNIRTVDDRMRDATKNDETKKDKSRDRSKDDTLNIVKFHILQSLPCNEPVIVRQALRRGADIKDLPEILWNFSHFKDKQRLTLVENPHFYENLPLSPDEYAETFRGRCIENCLPTKVFVPINKLRRVYFNFTGNRRVFDVWKTESTLIFKDVHGNLEGETTVERSINPCAPPFQYCKKHTQGLPEEVEITNDWRSPIRTAEDTASTHICVSAPSTQPNGRAG